MTLVTVDAVWCRESFTIGFLLNTKGLVELVVLNVGLDIGVLTKEIFAAFVVMAIWCVSILHAAKPSQLTSSLLTE
jgi:Kef-type K+ transport system membrane component KefB